MPDMQCDVVIIGAGPLGLTLATDLAQRDIAVTVVERRYADELPPVKCNHVSYRSMEQFRRLGAAASLRHAYRRTPAADQATMPQAPGRI